MRSKASVKKLKFLSNRYRECDYDYVAKLPEDMAQWLVTFSRGYYEGEGLEHDLIAKKQANQRRYRALCCDAMSMRESLTSYHMESQPDTLDPERLLLLKEQIQLNKK